MTTNFQLNFQSSESDEEEDDYWKNNGKNKFNKAIFTDSDSENESVKKTSLKVLNKVNQNENLPKSEEESRSAFSPQRKSVEGDQAPVLTSIGTNFIQVNPVSKRAILRGSTPTVSTESRPLSNSDTNNTSLNSNGSSTSSVTFNTEYSMRSKPTDQQLYHKPYDPKLTAPVPRPKFTMPASIIQSSAFTRESASVISISKGEPLADNKNYLKENLDLKTRNSKLEAEIKLLSLKLEEKPEFKTTINRILLDKPFWFDLYKSKHDKVKLLKEAIDSQDGNAILAVALFIKRTLNKDSFHGILINNPIALNQYIFYLEEMNDQKELYAFYKYHGNLNEAVSVAYFQPILCDKKLELSEQTQLFHEFEKSHSPAEIHLINNSSMLTAAKKNLKLQRIQKDILRNNSAFLRKDIGRQNAMDALNRSSLSYTVSFCLKFSRELNDNDAYSIENLKREFDLSTKQFSIWFIKSMSEVGSWSELENFTKQKGIFNMVKTTPVSYETVVFIISHVKGPAEQICKYLGQIENIDRRQQLAMKFKVNEVVIETFKIQRDKIGLLNYRNQFRENSPDFIKTNIVLMDDKIKWKN